MPARTTSLTPAPSAKRARVMQAPRRQAAAAAQGYYGTKTAREQKYVDVAAAAYVADTTGTITLLNGVAQGDDNTQRQGRMFNMTALSVKGYLSPVDGSTTPSYCRLIVVYDSATNGAAPTMTDILQASTSLSHNNLNNRMRFKVLIDEQYAIGATVETATQSYAQSPSVHTINRYVPLPKVEVVNNGTGATVASIQKGALWMVTIGSSAPNAGGVFAVTTRVRYLDD